ncbi:RCC1 domain-containing protein 1-like isoform X3 [Phycodurus eques]|uniref:RCC1 domain-containing protein 1-like isoform X3 n=1 Tax=Phycodurus eques TaxID=693459 RepID=UPI002ACD52CB|nr:RCC1 domain-containing protein 1-like isoform X3 [Phycodurus eques]
MLVSRGAFILVVSIIVGAQNLQEATTCRSVCPGTVSLGARMRWFGFGFNAFGQIHGGDFAIDDDTTNEVKLITPTQLTCHVDGSCCKKTSGLRASWSRRASLHSNGGRCLCLAGFKAASGIYGTGCTDAVIGESFLILAFPDRIESWDMDNDEKKTPVWSMELKTTSDSAGNNTPLNLPLITDGYIAIKPPFYRPLSPHLKATRLAMGAEHSVLLSASGAVYTWGLGSHGQLGHGGLSSEEQPRVVEALWGMTMSCIATGGWHTVCISDGGDLYVWGWNESGQLGLPSRAVRQAQQHQSSPAAADSSSYTDTPEGEKDKEVFISIQAFPALLDITPSCEVTVVGCGSRHTAAVTSAGDLYTWGWGQYGQLGYEASCSDEPHRVEFFTKQQMRVVNVTCGTWNTFAAVVKEEVAAS